MGSCGQANPDGAMIVAISPSHGNMCGRKLKVSNMGSNDGVPTSGQSVVVTVADTCPSCGPNDLDLSVGAVSQNENKISYLRLIHELGNCLTKR